MDDRDNHDEFEVGGNARFIPDRYDEGQLRCMRRLMHELLQRAQERGRRVLVGPSGRAVLVDDVDWQGAAVLNEVVVEEVRGDDSDA